MKNASRKTAATVLTLIGIAVFTCCACSKSDDDSPSSSVNQGFNPQADFTSNEDPGPLNTSLGNLSGKTASGGETGSTASGLRFLCTDDGEIEYFSEDGYYYISHDSIKLSDSNYGSHLMYMDYASCQEVYLCSAPGCSHDTPDCTAVLPNKDFPFSTKLFLFQAFLVSSFVAFLV